MRCIVLKLFRYFAIIVVTTVDDKLSNFSVMRGIFPPSMFFLLCLADANRGEKSPESSSALVAVQDVTDRSEFAALIASSDLTVVDYWAPWCKYGKPLSSFSSLPVLCCAILCHAVPLAFLMRAKSIRRAHDLDGS